jgi:mycoredoxin-dependent peroxiredoxin
MPLQVGDTAPDFSLRDGTGRGTVSLSDFDGRPVVLAFYALAFTGGWRRELQGFVEAHDEFDQHNAQVIAVSVDPWPAANAFGESVGAVFPVLGDWPLNKTGLAYDVYQADRYITGRVTYVIDKDRVIRAVIDDPRDMERHSKDALEAVKALP